MNIREYKTEVANNQRLRFYELSICIKEIFVAFPSLNGHYQFLKLVVLYCRNFAIRSLSLMPKRMSAKIRISGVRE